MILIGSRALLFHSHAAKMHREPKDFDFIATEAEAHDWLKKFGIVPDEYVKNSDGQVIKIIARNTGTTPVEFELVEARLSSKMLHDIVEADSETSHTDFGMIPNMSALYSLKETHRYMKSPYFWKTAQDVFNMRKLGCKIEKKYNEFVKLREEETYKSVKYPKLDVSKKEFFDIKHGVSMVYEHDHLHEAVKHLDMPAYKFFMKDDSEVLSDKEKFFKCSRDIQLYSTLEECYVLSLERSQIPFPKVKTPFQSFKMALEKVCSTITSGWFRKHSWESIPFVLSMYNENYIQKFENAVNTSSLKKIKNDQGY